MSASTTPASSEAPAQNVGHCSTNAPISPSTDHNIDEDHDDLQHRPVLPPRPVLSSVDNELPPTSVSEVNKRRHASKPSLRSRPPRPTTALSSVDIQTMSFPDGSRGTFDVPASQPIPLASERSSIAPASRKVSRSASEIDDTTSLMSYAPTLRAAGDLHSLLGDAMNAQSPAWKMLNSQAESANPFEQLQVDDTSSLSKFQDEFAEIPEIDTDLGNEESTLLLWKSKLKHYMILSSAGKPIWSRHGDLNLINGYIGIIQTIISFYQGAQDPLHSFTAGDARFVIATEGPLYLVAISRLNESDAQLHVQLDALYMQILSTLTLPNLQHIFLNRASSDLRRPLQGTEPLLASLADTFTKGSPTAMLSALECLKMRKSQRQLINNTLLKTRTDKLLYGLVVADGRLVSVVRPKRHSLHPGDLQLIFNMLFEARGVKAGGGENWIPLCLPGFNNRGYLYMYVSFVNAYEDSQTTEYVTPPELVEHGDEIAIILISADKESFFGLKQMRDNLVAQLNEDGSMERIKAEVRKGRPRTTDIVPGTQIRHFLYKSRANVQFAMPTLSPYFDSLLARRRLMSLYHNLHSSLHAKHNHLKILYSVGPTASRAALAQSANKIIQWIKREEERIFIIGGAVF